MPRSKREVMTEKANLCTRTEIEILNKSELIVQQEKRRILLQQMVGTLYPRIVADEMVRIEELLRDMR